MKTIIKRNTTKGCNFVQISHELLRNEKLTINAKMLMIELLSNDDSSVINYDTIIERIGLKEKGLRAAFTNLEENNYIIRNKKTNNRGYYYTIDETGNASSIKINEEPTELPPVESSNDYQDNLQIINTPISFSRNNIMKTQDQHEHEMISSLIYDLKMVFYTFKTRNGKTVHNTNDEIINTILSKVDITYQNAINFDYTQVISVCEELTERVGKLRDISKKQMIKQRAYDIIQTINW